jgi:hypothetical protein
MKRWHREFLFVPNPAGPYGEVDFVRAQSGTLAFAAQFYAIWLRVTPQRQLLMPPVRKSGRSGDASERADAPRPFANLTPSWRITLTRID